MEILVVLFTLLLAGAFGQAPSELFSNARPINPPALDATVVNIARPANPTFASEATFRSSVGSGSARSASDASVIEPQPGNFRANLITKGQKSINDFEISDKMAAAIAKFLDEPIDYVLSPDCPKAFGLFPVTGSCRQYIHCRTGIPYAAECAPNTVFDAAYQTCVHPDQSTRSECSAPEIHQFLCPTYSSALTRLRFGDHDRLAHPTDCSKFYACLLNGQPRLGSCPAPLVFDVTSGFCTNYKKVKGCETFYDHLKDEDDVVVGSARSVTFEQTRTAPVVIEDPPTRSAPAAAGPSKNFFNFEQKF